MPLSGGMNKILRTCILIFLWSSLASAQSWDPTDASQCSSAEASDLLVSTEEIILSSIRSCVSSQLWNGENTLGQLLREVSLNSSDAELDQALALISAVTSEGLADAVWKSGCGETLTQYVGVQPRHQIVPYHWSILCTYRDGTESSPYEKQQPFMEVPIDDNYNIGFYSNDDERVRTFLRRSEDQSIAFEDPCRNRLYDQAGPQCVLKAIELSKNSGHTIFYQDVDSIKDTLLAISMSFLSSQRSRILMFQEQKANANGDRARWEFQ